VIKALGNRGRCRIFRRPTGRSHVQRACVLLESAQKSAATPFPVFKKKRIVPRFQRSPAGEFGRRAKARQESDQPFCAGTGRLPIGERRPSQRRFFFLRRLKSDSGFLLMTMAPFSVVAAEFLKSPSFGFCAQKTIGPRHWSRSCRAAPTGEATRLKKGMARGCRPRIGRAFRGAARPVVGNPSRDLRGWTFS